MVKKRVTLKQKENRQLIWAVALMGGIILVVILVPYIKTNYLDKFVYIKLDFQKTQLGELRFYSTRVPVADKQGNIIGSYSMNFRNDPRKLEDVPVDIASDFVTFMRNETVYITVNPEMEPCGADHTIAMIGLVGFLRDFGNLSVETAAADKDYAELNNVSYVTCETHKSNTVIYIDSGNETSIKTPRKNCYELIYNNCEVIGINEKFMLEILEFYMEGFTRR